MLVEESTSQQLPRELLELLSSLQVGEAAVCDLNQHDIIISLLCVLMTECNLQPLRTCTAGQTDKKCVFDDVDIISLQELPNIWKSKTTGLYNISFVLGHFFNYRCRFVGIPSKDILIINVIVCGLPKQCYSMSIHCTDYVTLANVQWRMLPSIFHNLKDLSVKFKNSIAQPIRSLVLNEEGILNASLLGIPHEIQLKIGGYLGIHDISQLSQTCRYFNYLSKDQRLWQNIARTVMTKNQITSTEERNMSAGTVVDWKNECRDVLQHRRRSFCIRKLRKYTNHNYYWTYIRR